MAGTPLPSENSDLFVEDFDFNSPVSEAGQTKLGTNIQYLKDENGDRVTEIAALETVVNTPGNIDWTTQSNNTIPNQKLVKQTIAVNHTSSGTITLTTLSNNSYIVFACDSLDAGGIVNDTSGIYVEDGIRSGIDNYFVRETYASSVLTHQFVGAVAANAGDRIRAVNTDSGGEVVGTLYVYRIA